MPDACGSPAPVRVRAGFVTDTDIDDMASSFGSSPGVGPDAHPHEQDHPDRTHDPTPDP